MKKLIASCLAIFGATAIAGCTAAENEDETTGSLDQAYGCYPGVENHETDHGYFCAAGLQTEFSCGDYTKYYGCGGGTSYSLYSVGYSYGWVYQGRYRTSSHGLSGACYHRLTGASCY